MKKLLFVLPAALIISACNAEHTVNVMGVECTHLADGRMSSLVKCPITPELELIRSEIPTAMFQEGDFAEKHFTEYMAENPDNILVNIVPEDCGPNTTGYRILVKEPVLDGTAMYATFKCVTNE